MREIKFRARITQGLENAKSWVYWGIKGTDMLDALDLDTLGEFTGLLDKNGTEIYEGDVLDIQGMGGPTFKGIVEFGDGCFRDSQFRWTINYREHEMEIIGNIHENPELLEETP